MKEVNERMKSFITAYMPMARTNQEKKTELDELSAEVEELRQADEASEARYKQTMEEQFGITNPVAQPERAKDPLYLAKQRQREEMQAEYDEDTAKLKAVVTEKYEEVSKEIYALKEEVREMETKYLLNAQRSLEKVEQKLALASDDKELKSFQAQKDEVSEAIKNMKEASKAKAILGHV